MTQSSIVVDLERGKDSRHKPALYELFNRDIASLVRVNFGNKYCVSCPGCIYLVVVDIELVLSRPMFSCCFSVQDHLQVPLEFSAELLIQTCSANSSSILNFVKFLLLSKVSVHRNFLHTVGSSDLLNRCEEFFRYFRNTYSPLLGITKIISIGIRT